MPSTAKKRVFWLSRLTITKQFLLVGLLGLLIPLMAIGVSLRTSYVLALQGKQTQTRNLVDVAVSETRAFVSLAQQGKMTTAQAQQEALNVLGAARFDHDDYYFVLDDSGITEFPAARAMVEKTLASNPRAFGASAGKISGGEMVAAAIAGKPMFFQYNYIKPGSTKAFPKISYAVAVPEWGWVIGTGVYIDDLQADFINQLLHLTWLFLPVLVGYLALILLMRKTYSATMDRDLTAQTLEAKNAILNEMSSTDWLTGTANRRAFDMHLTIQLWQIDQTGTALSLIMLDVDHFKSYNDSRGHLAGDAALRELAGLMRSQLRDGRDILARYGGEEFAILMPGTDRDQAAKIAERIRMIVEAAELPHGGPGAGHVITVSVGIASAEPGLEHTESGLIEAADKALYRAKNAGRNRVALAHS